MPQTKKHRSRRNEMEHERALALCSLDIITGAQNLATLSPQDLFDRERPEELERFDWRAHRAHYRCRRTAGRDHPARGSDGISANEAVRSASGVEGSRSMSDHAAFGKPSVSLAPDCPIRIN